MRRIILALVTTLLPVVAQAQNAPATLGYHTVYGRIGATPGDTGPGQAIPFTTLSGLLSGGVENANTVYAGPTTGSPVLPTFRALIGADLPAPSASTLGGIESLAAVAHTWINQISTSGVPSATQPAFTDISGTVSTTTQIGNMTANTVLANATGSAAAPTNFAMPSCSGAAQALKYTTNTGIGCVTYAPAATNSTKASAASPGSTSAFKMMGLAGTITPATTGNIAITISCTLINQGGTAAGSGIEWQISYGTGGAPSNGASVTGTQAGVIHQYENPVAVTQANFFFPFSISVVVPSLTVGTAYWIDLAAESIVSPTGFSFQNCNTAAIEN